MGERVSGGRDRERERKVKCKEGKEREMREKKGGGSLRLVQNWCKNTKHRVHVCVCVCVATVSFPAGSSLSTVHCSGKGVSFRF